MNEPLYSELGGASSLSHSGNILIITDSINNRLIIQNTQNMNDFEVVDTLDFGIEHPIFAGFTGSG
jgi:hypothetical protein